MLEYIVIIPKRYFNQIHWNTTTSNTRIKSATNSEALHAQMCTHMNDITFLPCPDFEKKKKRSTYRPSQFLSQKGKQTFYFFRPKNDHIMYKYFHLTCIYCYNFIPVLKKRSIFEYHKVPVNFSKIISNSAVLLTNNPSKFNYSMLDNSMSLKN